MKKRNRKGRGLLLSLLLCLCLAGCMGEHAIYEAQEGDTGQSGGGEAVSKDETAGIEDIPAYDGQPYVTLNGNEPEFSREEMQPVSYEEYSPLDALGRCGQAEACIGQDLMPTKKRESISQVKPTGWHSVTYDFVEGGSLYNRCHLIGYQLTAENANERNLITGTRYMNVEGMLPFENLVADYIKETDHHVLYRVQPLFDGENLVAAGVQMEAWSVEDDGEGVCYNVFVYNVQPGISIDYRTGESAAAAIDTKETAEIEAYVLNTNSRKFHKSSCASAQDIKAGNREEYTGSRETLLQQGYAPCGRCKP